MSIERLELNGIMRVSDYAHVLPEKRDFALVADAMAIMAQKKTPENPHGGSSVFMTDMPEDTHYLDLSAHDYDSNYRKFTQHYYVKVLAKVLDVEYHIKRSISFRVDKATATDTALEEQKDAIWRYSERNKPGAIFMKDVALNLKDSRGRDLLDSDGNTIPDDEANDRLSDLTEFLVVDIKNHQDKPMPIFRVLPQEFYNDEPNAQDIKDLQMHDTNQVFAAKRPESRLRGLGLVLASQVVLF